MSDLFFRIIRHLLPSGQAWWLFPEKPLTKFIEGLTGFLASIRLYIDLVWLDTQPDTTRELEAWEQTFGLDPTGQTEQSRRLSVVSAWSANGGQSPRYLQDVIQAAGFDVYVHEWWVPGTNPPVPRNPVGALIFVTAQDGAPIMQDGDPEAQDGNIGAGGGGGYIIVNDLSSDGGSTPIPTDPEQFPYILYFGGEMFGTNATIPADRKNEFESLLLRIKPAQQWLGLMIEYV